MGSVLAALLPLLLAAGLILLIWRTTYSPRHAAEGVGVWTDKEPMHAADEPWGRLTGRVRGESTARIQTAVRVPAAISAEPAGVS